MKFYVLAMRDVKANHYLPPFVTPNIGGTMRDLRDMINNEEKREVWQKHPEDFELYELGEWDNENGYYDVERDGSTRERKQLCLLSALKD